MKAEELKANKILRGPIFPEPVQISICIPIGNAIKLVGKPQPGGSELEEITWKRASSLSDDEILRTFDQLG